ncbi:hypothetical protein PsorP6_017295 [Peronosclerospora sorghi]|uniref:Uncharacterized protein n=1 Tax=Peronosclerospora sorghi TaxID=230839 RepID=A0ACC0WNX6_9STRA|nr:hypothetical protein PsorP6_017295 [Peronosclerospora sorghi]
MSQCCILSESVSLSELLLLSDDELLDELPSLGLEEACVLAASFESLTGHDLALCPVPLMPQLPQLRPVDASTILNPEALRCVELRFRAKLPGGRRLRAPLGRTLGRAAGGLTRLNF